MSEYARCKPRHCVRCALVGEPVWGLMAETQYNVLLTYEAHIDSVVSGSCPVGPARNRQLRATPERASSRLRRGPIPIKLATPLLRERF